MTEDEKRASGMPFMPEAPELVSQKLKAHMLNTELNKLYEDDFEERDRILHELIGEIGDNTRIQGPVYFHYGTHTKIGKDTFINFNLTIQDDAEVRIGDRCNIGPNVTIVTPNHPMIPEERAGYMCRDGICRYLCYAEKVVIGNDCWLGANVVICPGVTIGDGCVIGAGSVVTKDIPDRCIAVGNPARILRVIGENDSLSIKFPNT